MANYNKFQCFVEDICEKKHNLAADTLKVAFSSAAYPPSASADVKLADITTIASPAVDSVTLSVSSSGLDGGVYKLVLADKTMTASADVGPFQYVIIYNDDATNDELIAWYDYGSEITLHANDTFKLDFGDQLFSLA